MTMQQRKTLKVQKQFTIEFDIKFGSVKKERLAMEALKSYIITWGEAVAVKNEYTIDLHERATIIK